MSLGSVWGLAGGFGWADIGFLPQISGRLALVEAYVEQNPGCHPLFRPDSTPCGGLSLWLPDWMHTKSLGSDAELLGSALSYFVKDVLPGSAEENMSVVWARVENFYKEKRTKCRLSRLTYNMVKHEPFPRLSAKAVETRDLLPAVLSLFEGWVGDPVCAWFHRLLHLSCSLDQIVFGNPGFMLSEEERRTFRTVVFEYHQRLSQLAHHFHEQGTGLLQLYFKKSLPLPLGFDCRSNRNLPQTCFLLHGRGLYVRGEGPLCSEQQRCRQFKTCRQNH